MLLLQRNCYRSRSLRRSLSSSSTRRWRGIISAGPGSSSSRRGLPLLVPALTHSRSLYKPKEAAAALFSTTGTPRSSHTTGSPPSSSSTLSSRNRNKIRNRIEIRTTSPTATAFLPSQTSPRGSWLANTPLRLFYSHKATPTTSPLPIMYEGKWTANTVRKTFLDYFAERGHTIGATHPFSHTCIPYITVVA